MERIAKLATKRTIQSKIEKQKNPPQEIFLYSGKMEHCHSNIKKFLILHETETLEKLLIFSQKKSFLMFLKNSLYIRKQKPRKNSIYFRK